jgi:hypothetical protein
MKQDQETLSNIQPLNSPKTKDAGENPGENFTLTLNLETYKERQKTDKSLVQTEARGIISSPLLLLLSKETFLPTYCWF